MTGARRILQAPAWLLHHRPFRDSSQLLDILSRDHGRLTLVARGSRGAKSRLRGILRPFMPLQVSWLIRSDLGTLTGAEMNGPPMSLDGDALLAGYYVNELLLNLLHRHDPQPEIFVAYENAVRGLAARSDVAACLREFEMALLRILGYALILDHEAHSRELLEPAANYEYRVEQGPVRVDRSAGSVTYSGETLLAIRCQEFSRPAILQAAGRLLKEVIAFHMGGRELKSRKVLLELRRTARIRDNASDISNDRDPL